MVGALPWPHVEAFVDELVTVAEDEILDAMRRIGLEAKLVAEPSGAVAAAAALAGRGGGTAAPAYRVAILSGGNVEPALLARALAERSP
jgi:threonine dehydratase